MGPSVTCNHACADAPRLHRKRFLKAPRDHIFCQCEKANSLHKREVQAMLVSYQQKVQECYFQKVTLEKDSEGLSMMTVCKCSLQPSCHS